MSESTQSSPAIRTLPRAKQIQIVVILCAITIASIALVRLVPSDSDKNNRDPEKTATSRDDRIHLSNSQLATITVAQATLMSFRDQVHTDGKIVPNGDRITQIFSPYTGRVSKVIAAPGDSVKEGAALFTMDANEYAQTQSDYLSAVAQWKLARNSEERKHAAFEAKGGSLQDWQQAQSDLVTAEANASAQRNKLLIFGKSNAEIETLERSGKPSAATNVASPVNGVVTDRQLGPGQYLQSGQSTPVYTVADLSTVWLLANVPEVDAPAVKPGQWAEVHVLALPNEIFKGRIVSVGAMLDPATRRVPVRASVNNPEGKLKPEMFATFSIHTSADTQAPGVPHEAVIFEGERARVWVLDNGDAILRAIQVGRTDNGKIEVLAGLHPGEKVVTRGSLFIDRAARPD